ILHILSGYNFDNNIDGYIVQVEALSSGITPTKITLANQSWTLSDTHFQLNSNPIRIGTRIYDRYIDFKIPSIKWTNQQFYSNPSNTNTLGYQISPNNKGFSETNPLYISLYEIDSTRVENRFRYFKAVNKKEIVVPIFDEHADIG